MNNEQSSRTEYQGMQNSRVKTKQKRQKYEGGEIERKH